MAGLPEGFVLDDASNSKALPDGFVVDEPHATTWGDVGKDVAKQTGAGLVEGAAGLATLPSAAVGTGYAGAGEKPMVITDPKTGKVVPNPDNPVAVALAAKQGQGEKVGANTQGLPEMPKATAEEKSDAIVNAVRSLDSQLPAPNTSAGGFARTLSSMVPGMAFGAPGEGLVSNAVRNVVAPGVLSEGLGQLFEGSKAEPYARLAGALTGSIAGPKLLSPISGAAGASERAVARNASLDNLREEGVTAMTAGDRAGSAAVKNIEESTSSMPFGGGSVEDIHDQARRQYTQAAWNRVGIDNATDTSAATMNRAADEVGGRLDALNARNNIHADGQLTTDLDSALSDYHDLTTEANRAGVVGKTVQAIKDKLTANGGMMTGDQYQAIRSSLGKLEKKTGDAALKNTLGSINDALDGAMERSIAKNNPGDLGAYQQTRGQYRNLLVMEHAAAAANGGPVTPAMLERATRAIYGKRGYVRGWGDMSQLAEDGKVLAPLNNSGTAQKEFAAHAVKDFLSHVTLGGVLGLGSAGAAHEAGQDTAHSLGYGLLGALGGFVSPGAAGRLALNNRPMQAYWGNQLARNAPRLFGGGGIPYAGRIMPNERTVIPGLLSQQYPSQ